LHAGRPDAIVAVLTKNPIRYGFEPIVLGGKLAVLRNDPSGMLYKLTEAELVETAGKCPLTTLRTCWNKNQRGRSPSWTASRALSPAATAEMKPKTDIWADIFSKRP